VQLHLVGRECVEMVLVMHDALYLVMTDEEWMVSETTMTAGYGWEMRSAYVVTSVFSSWRRKGKYRPWISVVVLSAVVMGICTRHLFCISKNHLEHSLSHTVLHEQARCPIFQPAGGLVIASCRLRGVPTSCTVRAMPKQIDTIITLISIIILIFSMIGFIESAEGILPTQR
jgi:hypothetical protein